MDTRQIYLNDAKNLIRLAKEATPDTYNNLYSAVIQIDLLVWPQQLGDYTPGPGGIPSFTPILPTDEEGENIFTALLKNQHLTTQQKYTLFKHLSGTGYTDFTKELYSEDNIKLLLRDPKLLTHVYLHFFHSFANTSIWKAIIGTGDKSSPFGIFQMFHHECMRINELEQAKGLGGLFDSKTGKAHKSGDVSKHILATMMKYIQCWLGELQSPEDILNVTKEMIKYSTSNRTIKKYNGEPNLSFTILKDYDFNSKVTQLAQLHILKLIHKKLLESPDYLKNNPQKQIVDFLKKSSSLTSLFKCATIPVEHSSYGIYTLISRDPKNSRITGLLEELEKSTEDKLNQNINPGTEKDKPISLKPVRTPSFFGPATQEHKAQDVQPTESNKLDFV